MSLPEFQSDVIDGWHKNKDLQEQANSQEQPTYSLDMHKVLNDNAPIDKEILQSLENAIWKIMGDI